MITIINSNIKAAINKKILQFLYYDISGIIPYISQNDRLIIKRCIDRIATKEIALKLLKKISEDKTP